MQEVESLSHEFRSGCPWEAAGCSSMSVGSGILLIISAESTGEVRPAESVDISNESLEVVSEFCYLDMISAGGGVEESVVVRITCG